MNISCVICTDLFSPSSQIWVTKCGHLFHNTCLYQWIERVPNCPQCRQGCNENNIIRLYINVSLNDSITSNDPTYLRFQVDELKLKIKELIDNNNEMKEQIDSAKLLQKNTKKTIIGMEHKLETQSLLIENLVESEKQLKLSNKKIPSLERKLKEANETIERMEHIRAVIECGTAEVDEMMHKALPVKTLCQMVTVLKRELKTNEQKRTELRNLLRTNQSEINKLHSTKKILVEKIETLESDIHKLESDKVDEKKENNLDYKSETTQLLKEKMTTHAATSSNSSDSPYLKIKSSSVVLAPKIDRPFRHPLPTTMSGLSIFKNPRVGARGAPTIKNAQTVSNGMGGSERTNFDHKNSTIIPSKRCKLSN